MIACRYLLIVCTIFLADYAQAQPRRQVKCNNCKPDPIPGMMWQTFMNVFINGYIATQSPANSPEQKQAIINALNTLSQFGQVMLKTARDQELTQEQLIESLEQYSQDKELIENCRRTLALEKVKMRFMRVY